MSWANGLGVELLFLGCAYSVIIELSFTWARITSTWNLGKSQLRSNRIQKLIIYNPFIPRLRRYRFHLLSTIFRFYRNQWIIFLFRFNINIQCSYLFRLNLILKFRIIIKYRRISKLPFLKSIIIKCIRKLWIWLITFF